MKKLLFGSIALTALLFSCSKKDSSSSNNSSTIVGKWNFVKDVDWYTLTGLSTEKDTTLAHPGEYIDFRTDGKVYAYYWDTDYYYDTANYVIKGSQLIINYTTTTGDDADTLDLQTLDANNLTLHSKYTGSFGTDESWEFYTR